MKETKYKIGEIISADLTTAHADSMRDFYKEVIGWQVEEMPMNDGDEAYNDYVMKDADGKWVGGVCHHRGANLGLPSQWIMYVNVASITDSVKKCIALGGKLVRESKDKQGNYHFVMIEDPGGAILGLTQL